MKRPYLVWPPLRTLRDPPWHRPRGSFDDDVCDRSKHVFVTALENEGCDSTFGASSRAPADGFPTNKDRLCLVTAADIQ